MYAGCGGGGIICSYVEGCLMIKRCKCGERWCYWTNQGAERNTGRFRSGIKKRESWSYPHQCVRPTFDSKWGKERGRPEYHVYRYKKVAERGGRLKVDSWELPTAARPGLHCWLRWCGWLFRVRCMPDTQVWKLDPIRNDHAVQARRVSSRLLSCNTVRKSGCVQSTWWWVGGRYNPFRMANQWSCDA